MVSLKVTIPNQGEFDECTTISPRLLPTNTVFESGNIFIYNYDPLPLYTTETAQIILWSTDIYGNKNLPYDLPATRP